MLGNGFPNGNFKCMKIEAALSKANLGVLVLVIQLSVLLPTCEQLPYKTPASPLAVNFHLLSGDAKHVANQYLKAFPYLRFLYR